MREMGAGDPNADNTDHGGHVFSNTSFNLVVEIPLSNCSHQQLG